MIEAYCSHKRYKVGQNIVLPDGSLAKVVSNHDAVSKEFDKKPLFNYDFNKWGISNFLPYIRKEDDSTDFERYQTTFALQYGSSAAPTAGLHFDEEVFNAINENKIDYSFVSLHVGLGTFQPIYSEDINDHIIHKELFEITNENAFAINQAKLKGKKILPIGTTSLRTIESALGAQGDIVAGNNMTQLYITGYKLKFADALFTNFHTPNHLWQFSCIDNWL